MEHKDTAAFKASM